MFWAKRQQSKLVENANEHFTMDDELIECLQMQIECHCAFSQENYLFVIDMIHLWQ